MTIYRNTARALCMLDSKGYRLLIFNCFRTAKTVTRTSLIVTFYVHCLSCYITTFNILYYIILYYIILYYYNEFNAGLI